MRGSEVLGPAAAGSHQELALPIDYPLGGGPTHAPSIALFLTVASG